jgi:alanyl-tRNA synthetase
MAQAHQAWLDAASETRIKMLVQAVMLYTTSGHLAVSEGAGIDAGKQLKAALTEVGGRGGGTARIAQGSLRDAAALEKVLAKL